MKNLKFINILALVVIAFLVVYACSKDDSKVKSGIAPIVESRNISNLVSGINFPGNTTFTVNGNTVHWQLPTGYTAVGVNNSWQYFRATAGDVTCTCTKETGGCSPATANGGVACVMTTCSECTKKESLTGIIQELTKIIVINDSGLTLVTNFSQLKDKKLFSGEFKDLPEFNAVFNQIATLQIESENPNLKKTIFADILGIIFTCEIPADIDDSSLSLFKGPGDDGKVSCSCLSPSTGVCPLDNKWVAKWCDASNCQSCKMSGAKVVDRSGQIQNFVIDENGFIRS